MTSNRTLAGLALALLAAPAPAEDARRLPAWVARAYPLIKPAAGELRWQKIPWLTDVGAAVAAAKREGRPILLWTSGDDPLGRC